MVKDVKLGGKPTGPPPDPNKPYIWVAGEGWMLVAMDTTDGVPKKLNLPGDNTK